MTYTFKELKKKTAAELKDIAKGIEHEAVKGYTQLNKDHLITAICKAMNIEMHEHHEVVGVNKAKIKADIRKMKKERDKILEAKDPKKLKEIRQQIKSMKRKLKKATI